MREQNLAECKQVHDTLYLAMYPINFQCRNKCELTAIFWRARSCICIKADFFERATSHQRPDIGCVCFVVVVVVAVDPMPTACRGTW